jgi:hypothetical protein
MNHVCDISVFLSFFFSLRKSLFQTNPSHQFGFFQMELDQQIIIHFLMKDGAKTSGIHMRLENQYEEDEMEWRWGRIDKVCLTFGFLLPPMR